MVAHDRSDRACPGLASVLASAELLLTPERVLDILRTFTLFSRRSSTAGGYTAKIIPRYPQVEAVDAIVARCPRSQPPSAASSGTTRAPARRWSWPSPPRSCAKQPTSTRRPS